MYLIWIQFFISSESCHVQFSGTAILNPKSFLILDFNLFDPKKFVFE